MERVVTESSRLTKELLETNYCYILDADTEIFMWSGKSSLGALRKSALEFAKKALNDNPKRPKWSQIAKVYEGTETVLFKEKFEGWSEMLIQMAVVKGHVAEVKKDVPIDWTKVFKQVRPEDKMVDDGSGKIEVCLDYICIGDSTALSPASQML
jgi:hypothetical protein